MKVHRVLTLFMIWTLAPAGAFEYPSAPDQSHYSSSLWRKRNVVTIPAEGLELNGDVFLVTDELVLNGPLVSNGHSLRVDALLLTFNEGGAIKAFSRPAQSGAPRAEGAPGPQATRVGEIGGNGKTPIKADAGVDGNQSPQAIVIYAGKIAGKLNIDVQGQAGGTGGHGGQGGRGGKGGPGQKAKAGWMRGGKSGKDGARGGQGAPGGEGGKGGRGGAPVPLVLATNEQLEIELSNGGGLPGEPGEAGLPGLPGPGGDGGLKDKSAFLGNKKRGGEQGPPGPEQLEHGAKGESGDAAPSLNESTDPLFDFAQIDSKSPGVVILDFATLNTLRTRVAAAWTSFHWSRTLGFLILDSLLESTPERHLRPLTPDDLQRNVNGVADAILASATEGRVQTLSRIWKESLIVPLRDLAGTGDKDAAELLKLAEPAFEFFDLMGKGQSRNQDLKAKLDDLSSSVQQRITSKLNNAAEACTEFNEAKRKTLRSVLTLTSVYSIPVCEGHPDMRRPENIDKKIVVYNQARAKVPFEMKRFFQQTAQWRPTLFILPRAHAAETFEVIAKVATTSTEPGVGVPPPGTWIAPNLGVFLGFPQITRAKNLKDLAAGLNALAQTLQLLERP